MVETQLDPSTIDLSTSCIALRSDLVFIPQAYRGQLYYHIEVPTASRYYRIGYPEYVFISLLDGHTTCAEALTITAQKLGPSSLQQHQALAACSWLLENGLAYLVTDRAAAPLRRISPTPSKLLGRINPFWLKLPLGRPDRLIANLLPFLGWLFSRTAVICSGVLFTVAAIAISSHWDRFLAAADAVFSPSNWFWMLACWLTLKVVHEFGHGMVCRRYGGEVREMGIVFILLAPMAYVDVTSSWRFASKWQRIAVAMAGMYVELLIAAVASLAWCYTESRLAAHLLHNLVLMASASTIIFNLNPLMRFDGYYVVSDLLEIPNLYAEGTRFVQRRLASLVFGTRPTGPELAGKTWFCVGVYGVAVTLWRILVCASLVLAASVLLHGIGIVLAVAGVVCWIGIPIKEFVSNLARLLPESPLVVFRAVLVCIVMAISLAVALIYVPNPFAVTVPGIVDYEDLAVVRSGVAGFVQKVHVQDGQLVEAGQLLLELTNHDIVNEYDDIIQTIQQSRIRHRVALNRHQTAAAQMELGDQQALERRLFEKQREYDGLTLRAPVAGRVMGRQLAQLNGAFVDRGQELLAIGNEDRKEIVLSIGHDEIDEVLPSLGKRVSVRIGSRPKIQGTLSRVEPRASTRLTHVAMAATDGGRLTVRPSQDPKVTAQQSMELVTPRFRAVIAVPVASSRDLLCGERGVAIVARRHESLGVQVAAEFHRWIQEKLRRAESR